MNEGIESTPKIIATVKEGENDSLSYADFLEGVKVNPSAIMSIIKNSCDNDYFYNQKIVVLSNEFTLHEVAEMINKGWTVDDHEFLERMKIKLEVISSADSYE